MIDCEINTEEHSGISFIRISGRLDSTSAPALEDEILRLIRKQKVHLIIDFKNVDYMSSSGLGVLSDAIQYTREKNGDIKLIRMKKNVFRLFDLTGFAGIYSVYNDEDEAVKSFHL